MAQETGNDPGKRERTPTQDREREKREAPGQRDEKHPMDVGGDVDEDDEDLIDDDSDDFDESDEDE